MEIKRYDGTQPQISNIKAQVSGNQVTLTFRWPNDLESLYIYKQNLMQEEDIDWEKPYRKYTKNEYARFGGFIDQEAKSAISKYILCPHIQDRDGEYLLQDTQGTNEIKVISQRIQVRYTLQEKKKLFSSRKKVQMHVFCEVPLPMDYLCYVKKKGSIPISLEDGMQFQFISDFNAGDNILPEIEVDQDEYVRIYLTEQVPYKEAYHIMKS